MNWLEVGTIQNYYGGVLIAEFENKFYWRIRDCDDSPRDGLTELLEKGGAEEIPEQLYIELLKLT